MNNKILIVSLFIVCRVFCQTNPSHTYQGGYVKKDGKYINGHYKTTKNKTEKDNFVSKPNYNPYNGKKGYKKSKK